jgi:hypothetical protein
MWDYAVKWFEKPVLTPADGGAILRRMEIHCSRAWAESRARVTLGYGATARSDTAAWRMAWREIRTLLDEEFPPHRR